MLRDWGGLGFGRWEARYLFRRPPTIIRDFACVFAFGIAIRPRVYLRPTSGRRRFPKKGANFLIGAPVSHSGLIAGKIDGTAALTRLQRSLISLNFQENETLLCNSVVSFLNYSPIETVGTKRDYAWPKNEQMELLGTFVILIGPMDTFRCFQFAPNFHNF